MRYRALTEDEDYQFAGSSRFLVDSPEAVAQAIKTRLRLMAGEWFLDTEEGLDLNLILGSHTQGTRDAEIQRRILDTQGVLQLLEYASNVESRHFSVTAKVETSYGAILIEETFS